MVIAVLAGGLRAAASSAAVRGRVRQRLLAELTARFPGAELGDAVEIGWTGEVSFGPVRIPARAGGPALIWADSARVRPRSRLSLSLHEAHVALPAGELLRARPAPASSGPATSRALSADVEVDRLFLHLRDVEGPLLLAPLSARATVRRDENGALSATAQARFAGGGTASARLDLDGGTRAALSLELRRVGTGALSEVALARVPVGTLEGGASLDARVASEDGFSTLAAEWALSLDAATLAGPRLAVRPVGPVSAGFRGKARLDARARRLEVGPAELWLGPAGLVRASLSADLHPGDSPSRVELRAAGVSYRDLVEALPEELRPVEEAPRCGGPLSGTLTVQGPLEHPESWDVNGKLDVSQVRLAYGAPRPFLLDAFEHTAVDGRGQVRTTWIGPESPTYVPFRELPPHVPRAILVSEDAGFFGHRGFDFDEIRQSIVRALRTGARVRGASTVTQQLTKNLFLSRERTYARKVREALITVALEATVPKERLLEVYLNLIEWGPDVYGIGEAAQHYFGVDARQLTAKQAAFLGTIIPNPVRYHFLFERGELTPVWDQHVADVLAGMRENEYLDDAGYQAALAEPLVFRRDDSG
ncbi:MAG TPA: biosynthetic peptidoglycan transglycosylase [Myxococcales bacterium]|nr:biosynthetic peptidoglycan transglycosylase [Myxococcales bacterium]